MPSANRGNPPIDFSMGSFQLGDQIMGIGIQWVGGSQVGSSTSFLSIDRNGTGPFTPSMFPPGPSDYLFSSGSGAVRFNTVSYGRNKNCVFQFRMSSPDGGIVFPAGSGDFYNSRGLNFWGQTFITDTEFYQGLPFRSLADAIPDGVVNAGNLLSSQWFLNATAFDRAGTMYSTPEQSVRSGWSFALGVYGSGQSQLTYVIGRQLPWFGVAFDAGVSDAGVSDAGVSDAGVSDAGTPECDDAACAHIAVGPGGTNDGRTLVFESTSLGCQEAPGAVSLALGICLFRRRGRLSLRCTRSSS
jgi:hypothetical protein